MLRVKIYLDLFTGLYCSGSVYLDLFSGLYCSVNKSVYTVYLGCMLRVGISLLVSWVRIAQGRYTLTCFLGCIAQETVHLDIVSWVRIAQGRWYIWTCFLGTYCSGSVYLDLFPGYVLLRVGIS